MRHFGLIGRTLGHSFSAKFFNGKFRAEQIDADYISAHLYSRNYPDPDLVIRTGGEYRLSNFLMWQAAYSELYFTPTLWPDFDKTSFDEALEAYAQRNRRFGLVK